MLEGDLADFVSLPNDMSCMYKVPQILYDANKEAYTNLLSMHSLKKTYLQSFLQRTGKELGTYVDKAQVWEEKVHGYYDEEECGLNSDELVHMILMDGIFILELTMQYCYDGSIKGSDGLIMEGSLKDDIMRDLTLLENQLPFFVLQALADHSFPHATNHEWILDLTKLFNGHSDLFPEPDRNKWNLSLVDSSGTCNILHLVAFIHEIIRINSFSPVSTNIATRHEIIRINCFSTFRGPKLQLSRSATELQQAGVKLECAEGLILTNIDFMENGVLRIPRIVVKRNTESLFRNIIAYEHCHRKGHIFRSYVILMDCLINTSQDVQLLVDSGIIQNSLGETEDVCTLFNNLYKMPMMDSSEFHFTELCQRLNKYSRDPWHKWKATWFRWKLILRRDYFSSPWSIFSVMATFILLGLSHSYPMFNQRCQVVKFMPNSP